MNEVTRFFGSVSAICVKRARPLAELLVGRPSLLPLPSGPGVAIGIEYFGPKLIGHYAAR